jgi:hypothetical protein
MVTILYSLSLVFIWVEIIQFRKQAILYSRMSVDKNKLFLFSLAKLINFISIPLGFFTPLKIWYFILFGFEMSKFLILFTKNHKIINLYNLLSTVIYIVIYFTIFIVGVVL